MSEPKPCRQCGGAIDRRADGYTPRYCQPCREQMHLAPRVCSACDRLLPAERFTVHRDANGVAHRRTLCNSCRSRRDAERGYQAHRTRPDKPCLPLDWTQEERDAWRREMGLPAVDAEGKRLPVPMASLPRTMAEAERVRG